METPEIERELDELEGRMERLRALYEQYFLGIEKLEPQIPRKEVERRMQILRREQIRNTGLRFKFQMLIQRYNTLQQYWARVTREIENGTYRRDVIRAAARFGAKEALTIFGKRRAAKYAALAEAQEKTRGRHVKPEDDATELQEDDLVEEVEVVLDETPPPAAAHAPAAPTHDPSPPLAAVSSAAPAPAAPKGGLRWGGAASSDPVSAIRPSGDDAKRRVAALAAEMKAQRAAASAKDGFGALDLDLEEAPAKALAAGAVPAKVPVVAPLPKAPAAVSLPKAPAMGRAAPLPRDSSPSGQFGGLDSPFDFEEPVPPPRPAGPPSTGLRNLRPASIPPARDSQVSAVRPAVPAPRPPVSSAAAKPAPSPVASAAAPAARPAPVARPAVATPPPAAASAPEGALPDQRIRQIYSKYVEAKRAAQESTAGVTFDKLAAKLRADAEKLKAAHPAKSVDYEVVLKDGKPLLKPVLR